MSEFTVAFQNWLEFLDAQAHPARLYPPATPAEIAATEQKLGLTFPADLRELYLLGNGSKGGLVLGDPLYTLAELEAAYNGWNDLIYGSGNMEEESLIEELYSSQPPQAVQLRYWIPGWIPLCGDDNGNHIACDLAPGPVGVAGQLINMGADEDNHIQLALTLPELWQISAEFIAQGHLRFSEDGRLETPAGYVPFAPFRERYQR